MLRRIYLFLGALLFSVHGIAGTSVYNGRMNDAVSGVVAAKMNSYGFSLNDPRFMATKSAIASALGGAASYAVGAAFGASGPPGWIAAAVGLGLGALAAEGLPLAVDGALKWFSADNKTVSVAVGASSTIVAGKWSWGYADRYFSTIEGAAQYHASLYCAGPNASEGCSASLLRCESGKSYCWFRYNSGERTLTFSGRTATFSCSSGVASDTECLSSSSTSSKTVPVADAADLIPQGELSKQVDPALTAAMIDAAWKRAVAASDYSGVPYDLARPVMQQDVVAWNAANPSLSPTVADIVAPMAPVDSASVPTASGNAGTQSGNPEATSAPVNPAASQPQVNLGSDPGIGSPSLESVPSASDILKPILNLLPDWRAFKLPEHQSECPKPRMDLWGKEIIMTMHCDLLEQHRSTIQAIMTVVWTLAAAIIILGA